VCIKYAACAISYCTLDYIYFDTGRSQEIFGGAVKNKSEMMDFLEGQLSRQHRVRDLCEEAQRGPGGEGRAQGTAYLLRPRVDVWPAAGRCRCFSFGRLSAETRDNLASDQRLSAKALSKGPMLHDPSAGSA